MLNYLSQFETVQGLFVGSLGVVGIAAMICARLSRREKRQIQENRARRHEKNALTVIE